MNEQVLLSVSKILDPPKSPLKKGDFERGCPPIYRGASAVFSLGVSLSMKGEGETLRAIAPAASESAIAPAASDAGASRLGFPP
jgi:hypothetical protein